MVVRSAQLLNLTLELRDPLRVSARRARPVPRVNSARFTQPLNDWAPTPSSRAARATTPWLSPVSRRISRTIRTARSRSSSGYFCGPRRPPLLVAMLHPRFQGQEHPRSPGRIRPPSERADRATGCSDVAASQMASSRRRVVARPNAGAGLPSGVRGECELGLPAQRFRQPNIRRGPGIERPWCQASGWPAAHCCWNPWSIAAWTRGGTGITRPSRRSTTNG